MKQTSHYSFGKPDLSDQISPEAFNNNWDKADVLFFNADKEIARLTDIQLPQGGTAGQPLIKSSDSDYATKFGTLPIEGGGTGKTKAKEAFAALSGYEPDIATENATATWVVNISNGKLQHRVIPAALSDGVSKSANTVYCAPNGSNGNASFRKLVAADISSGAVTADKIVSGAVIEAKIGSGAVTNAKIGSGAVTEAKIGSSAVTTAKIADGAVTAAKIGSSAVAAAKIADGAVTAAKIGSGAVTEAKIGSGAVTAGKIGSNAVTEAKIAGGAVTAAKAAAGTAMRPDVLYSNATGSDNITTLSASAANYTHMRIYFKSNDGYYSSVDAINPNGKSVSVIIPSQPSSTQVYIKNSVFKIDAKSIKVGPHGEFDLTNNGAVRVRGDSNIKVVRVEAWN